MHTNKDGGYSLSGLGRSLTVVVPVVMETVLVAMVTSRLDTLPGDNAVTQIGG